MRISFMSKVTRVNKATIVANDTQVYVPPFWFCFLNFIPVNRAEMNRQQILSRFPGSYEEALSTSDNLKNTPVRLN